LAFLRIVKDILEYPHGQPGLLLKTLVGRSGVAHSFDEVISRTRGKGVVQRFSIEVTALDVVATYAKAIDVGARLVVLIGPSCSDEAQRLLEEYGMELRIAP
jgi:hypothetical protein